MENKETKLDGKVKHIQAAQVIISGKWKLSILIAVGNGISRFRDLQRNLSPIMTRSLSHELKSMESIDLMLRIAENSDPACLVKLLLIGLWNGITPNNGRID